MKKEQVVEVLENFVNGKGEDWDWDDFISVRLKDPKLEEIRRRCLNLDKEFPPVKPGQYCNDGGIKVLLEYITQLKTP